MATIEEIRATCAKIANKNIKVQYSREEKQHFFQHNFHSWQLRVLDSSPEPQGAKMVRLQIMISIKDV